MELIKNTPIIANNIRNVKISQNISRNLLAQHLGTTPYKIKLWEDGKGKVPINIAEKFACIAHTELSKFCSQKITAEEIMNNRFTFDAKSIFEIEQKYPDLLLR